MEFTTLEVEAAPPRGRLTLNRPEKLNPLSTTTLQELAAAARWFDAQPGVKVVVVGGHGRAFSAGADLAAFDGGGRVDAAGRREAADAGRQMAEAVEATRRNLRASQAPPRPASLRAGRAALHSSDAELSRTPRPASSYRFETSSSVVPL